MSHYQQHPFRVYARATAAQKRKACALALLCIGTTAGLSCVLCMTSMSLVSPYGSTQGLGLQGLRMLFSAGWLVVRACQTCCKGTRSMRWWSILAQVLHSSGLKQCCKPRSWKSNREAALLKSLSELEICLQPSLFCCNVPMLCFT